ncbi:MAG: hypothetical protein CL477_17030 [Acidobacteria bacterium]|jgi:CxxC motif-containing protein (DUF1111 family)|nr:hypothetical protein [Acidobacteriota bacterium]
MTTEQGTMTRSVLAALVIACVLFGGSPVAQSPPAPGDPLPGLTPVEFELFSIGLDDFLEVEDAEEGLGPAYNGTSCGGCHNVPAVGGISPVAELRAGMVDAFGNYSDFDPDAGSLFQLFSIPTHGCQVVIPGEANVIARRVPIPVFGGGLVEAIPDDSLLALADPLDLDRDGVSGRAAVIEDVATGNLRVGRFGWKSQQATLLAFGADAYLNEMGITSDLFPNEQSFGIDPELMRLCDPLPDPEDKEEPATGRRGIDNFESFMTFLAPIGRGAIDDEVRAGELVFGTVGCATCHVPSLQTGPSTNPLFDRKTVSLYSDLLLHDVGTGDGIAQAAAAPNEVRTPALWGLRFRRPLLHDGSAATPTVAIRAHGVEADLARRGFDDLDVASRASLLAFLGSL